MLGCQTHLWVHRQLPRSWSRTITLVGWTYDVDIGGHVSRFQVVLIFSLPKTIHLRARAVRVVVMT